MAKNTDEMGKKVITLPLQASRYVRELTNEQAGRLFHAMIDYHEGMPVAVGDDIKGVWQTLECIFLMQEEEAEERSKRNRANIMKRWNTTVDTTVSIEENEEENEKERSKEKDKEEEKEEEKKTHSVKEKTGGKCFVPPTLEEVRAHIAEKGYTHVNADMFWNFYESKGWTVGKERMKSWRGAVAYWESKHKEEDNRRRQEQQQPKPWDTSAAARAYRMTHFAAENDPSVWERQQKIVDEMERKLKIKK